ncbi:MAG: hypothetical protein ACK4KW_12435 [Gemmobacter sp.]
MAPQLLPSPTMLRRQFPGYNDTQANLGIIMQETTTAADASGADSREDWLAALDRIGEDAGYFEPLGRKHWAFFVDAGPQLLVTFETLDEIRARAPGQMPLGHDIAATHGWSHLCLIADGPTWYRDRAVWGYFDRLVDDAFFEDFDRVVFFGEGQGGYAACAYSVAAPGATVLALQPCATLSPAVAGWDGRDRAARRLDWTSRYGYAPDMVDGATRVWLVFDPLDPPAAIHAALFRKPHVTRLEARHAGARLGQVLDQIGALRPLIDTAVAGVMSPQLFYRLWRARRNSGLWLRNVQSSLSASGRQMREAVFVRAVTRRINAPRFRRRLKDLVAALELVGRTMPPERPLNDLPPADPSD